MMKLILLSLLTLLIGITDTTKADEQSEGKGVEHATPFTVDPGKAAGRGFIDPVTGKLGPPPSAGAATLSEKIRQKLSRSSKGLEMRTLPDGTRIVDLQGRFQTMSVGTLDEHGNVHQNCSHSIHDIERALASGADSAARTAGSAP